MDREAIIYQLRRALSQDPQVVKDAEIFINNWKQNALYYTNLYSIFVDTNLENEVRWIAVIEFRNHVDILWRKSGKMTLDAESRKFIRENLLPASESCALPLALQNALIASRIVRIDFPNEWPNFFETLINRANTLLSSNQWELALRHFITLHHAVKVLGSNRLPRSRLIFQQIAPQLLDFLVSVVFPLAENWLTNINNADSDARVALNWIASITRYGLKTSRRLIPGFRDLNSSIPAQSFFKNGLQLYSNVVSYLESQGQKQASLDDNFHQIVWKHALVINKIFIDLAEYPPMLSSLNYTKDYLMAFTEVINHTGLLFKTADESLFDFVELFSKLSVLCIRSLSHVLTELTDGTTLTSESTQSMYVELFNQEYVSQLFIVLVTAFVVLRKNDFEEWKDDPEHWVTEQLSEDVGYNIRPSAEHLVQCLFTLFKNLLIPQLQVSLSAVSQLPSSFENVIEQDAILSIIGASAESIQDIFQFEPWFLSIYNGLSDVQDVNISLVFRRRVSILISQFAPFVSNEDTIRLIYSLLPKFLTDSPCNDCVVKLTALRAYKDILDDYNFKDSCFAAVRDEVTQSMINLAPSFDVAESRQLVLDSLTALLNRLGKSVTPYAETIVNLLLQLWTDWEEEGILRAGTVSVMSVFVNAIKTGAEPFHFVLSRIVECSTNLDSDDHVMLETDGLELWAACLQNTTTLSEHFSHLFPNIIRYMLLEPTLLSGDVATYTLTQFRLLMDDVKNETFEFLSYSLSMLLMNCPMENISEPLVASGLLSMEITKVLENKEHPVKLSSCCLFLSRLAFRSPDLIILVCDQASADGSAMTKLVENWIQLYDHISSPGNRKLCILGLTSLLPSNHTGVLQNMNPLMHLWFSGLSEVEEDANGDAQIYYKNEDMSEFGFYLDPQTAEAKRKELMISQDAVHTVSLKSFISQAFTGCAQHYGGLEAFRASCLQNVDSALLDQFSTML